MSKTLYIFTRQPSAYAPKRIFSEAQRLGLSPKIINYRDLVFKFYSNKSNSTELSISLEGKALPVPDIAIFRSPYLSDTSLSVWNALFEWCQKNGTKILNKDVFSSLRSFDKLSQHLLFQENSIPFVETSVYSKRSLVTAPSDRFPFIAKASFGSHGDFVWKIKNEEELLTLKKKDAPFLVQPMLPNARDVRVIILGQKPIGAMLREAKEGSHLSNFSAGGSVSLFDLDKNKDVYTLAESISRKLNLEYCGLDLMQDTNGNWLALEINLFCQFEGFEKATKINVAKALVSYLVG